MKKKELVAIHKIGQKSYLRTQQIDNQSTSATSDSSCRTTTNSSPTPTLTDDDMEIEASIQQLDQQPVRQAKNAQPANSQRPGRDLPRKNYNIEKGFSSLGHEEA